jgi:ribonuclease HI
MKIILNTDGGARGNPGPAAIAAILKDVDGAIIKELGIYIGKTTNNEAEYRALLEGVKCAADKKADELDCYLDSELVVKQLTGEYKVKNANIKKFWTEIKKLEKNFKKITYTHVPREENFEADALVNEVLDSLAL